MGAVAVKVLVSSRDVFGTSAAEAGVAQLVEHLTCNEDVAGSTPVAGSFRNLEFFRESVKIESGPEFTIQGTDGRVVKGVRL